MTDKEKAEQGDMFDRSPERDYEYPPKPVKPNPETERLEKEAEESGEPIYED